MARIDAVLFLITTNHPSDSKYLTFSSKSSILFFRFWFVTMFFIALFKLFGGEVKSTLTTITYRGTIALNGSLSMRINVHPKTAIILFLMFFICTFPYLCVTLWSVITTDRIGFGIGFITYFIFTLKRSLFPAIYIFRNRVIWSYIQETVTCAFCRGNDNSSHRDSLSYGAATDQTTSCFTIFGRNFYRSRIDPSVFDGEKNYFPKNLEVCFVCDGKEVIAVADKFTDITKVAEKKSNPSSSSVH